MVVAAKHWLACAGIAAAILAVAATLVPIARGAEIAPDGAGGKLPRFAVLRFGEVNLRVGPGRQYPIEWVLTRRGMPVEILRKYDHWRQVRDWQGTIGWVHERMVISRPAVMVTGTIRGLHRRPDAGSPLVARAEPGVVAKLLACRGNWCQIEAAQWTGWVRRGWIWGVLPADDRR